MIASSFKSGLLRKCLMLTGSLLLLAVSLIILLPMRQQYPHLFFNSDCRKELTALSNALLEHSESSTLGLRRKFGDTTVVYGSGLPANLLEDVDDVLHKRRLSYVYVDKEHGTVAWRSVFLQTGRWYMYGSDGLSESELPPSIRSTERLHSDWFSFLR